MSQVGTSLLSGVVGTLAALLPASRRLGSGVGFVGWGRSDRGTSSPWIERREAKITLRGLSAGALGEDRQAGAPPLPAFLRVVGGHFLKTARKQE